MTGTPDPFQGRGVPWSQEASYALPVSVWREMMDLYYPNSGALFLRRDVLDRLMQWKADRGLLSFDQALESLLDGARTVS